MKKFLDQEKEREREEKNFGDSVLTYYSEYPMKRKNNKTRQVLTVPVLYYSILELPPARFILKLLLLFIL